VFVCREDEPVRRVRVEVVEAGEIVAALRGRERRPRRVAEVFALRPPLRLDLRRPVVVPFARAYVYVDIVRWAE